MSCCFTLSTDGVRFAKLWPAYRRFELWWVWRRYFGCRLVRAPSPLLSGRGPPACWTLSSKCMHTFLSLPLMLMRCNGPSWCSAAPGDATEAIPGPSKALRICGVPACGACNALEDAVALCDGAKRYVSWLSAGLPARQLVGQPTVRPAGHRYASPSSEAVVRVSCKHVCIEYCTQVPGQHKRAILL